jgi:hypothetical protein
MDKFIDEKPHAATEPEEIMFRQVLSCASTSTEPWIANEIKRAEKRLFFRGLSIVS